MIDVNIVASKNTAKLLELECKRLDLVYSVSSAPLDEARLYIIDTEFYKLSIPHPDKTIAIDSPNTHKARYNLPKTFLLSELRQFISKAMIFDPSKENFSPVKKPESAKLSLNTKKQSVRLYGQEIQLSQTEFRLLHALLNKKGEVLTNEEINNLIDCGSSNKANVYICFLRKKLEIGGEKIIYSIRGRGFMIK